VALSSGTDDAAASSVRPLGLCAATYARAHAKCLTNTVSTQLQKPMNDQRPVGELFTHIYQSRGAPTRDNAEFRQRLTAYLHTNAGGERTSIANHIAQETGYCRPFEQSPFELFKALPIEKALTLITIIWRFYFSIDGGTARNPVHASARCERWRQFVQRALREENVGYSVDAKCGVHFLVDDEFEHNRSSSIRGLSAPKYSAVLSAFNSAHAYLDPSALDTKAAVRCMFEALEIQAKLMVQTQNLNKFCAQNLLRDVAVRTLGKDEIAAKVIDASFRAFGEWIDGLHSYRHGQGTTAPIVPPIDLAVHILSTGAAYLRLLVDVDQQAAATS
jgi:hypothetical protein